MHLGHYMDISRLSGCCCDSPAALIVSCPGWGRLHLLRCCPIDLVLRVVSDEFSSWTDVVWNLVPLHTPDKHLICRDHSFLWNAEFWAKSRNLPISVDFLYFCRIYTFAEFSSGRW